MLVYGGQKFAVRVQADPVAAAARNISLEDIRTALAKTNSNTPVGTIAGERQNITLSASAAISKAEDYKKVIVAYRNGAPVKLDEIANVVDGVENNRIASFFNGNRSVVLAIQRQPDANTVAVVDSVKDRIPAYRAQIPASINMEVMMDRSISVRESVHDVQETLLIAIGLVVLVIFLFLRTVSATIIPALAVPISLIATCAVMYAFNFSINNMTLLALTLSVGFVVDDAIVMLENIVRHIEGGMRPFEAALKGAREIGFTIISITVSLIAVFIPVLLMGGMVGRVFREFAVTISVAIIVSGFVSLTLTPMLCARVLRTHHPGEKQNVVLRAFEWMFNGWLRGYEWSLDKVLKYKFITLMITLGTMVGTAYLYVVIPKGFFPVEDTGMISVTVEGPADISFRAMQERQSQIADLIRQDPAVAYLNSTVGIGGPNATNNTGRMFVGLKPKAERGPSGPVLQRLRRTTANVVGMAVYFREIQNINLGGRISKGEFQYTMQSSETDTLYRVSDEMLERIKTIPGLRDVNSDLYIKNPEIEIEIDREKAAFYGISVDQIRQELYNAFGNRQVATIYSPINDYQVILETRPDFQADTTGLSKIYLKTSLANTASDVTMGGGVLGTGTPNGMSIPLSAVTRLVPKIGPLQVNHQGQQPSVTISFNLVPGTSLGQAVDAIHKIERDSNLPLSITTGFQGNAQVFQESLKGQGILVLAADVRRVRGARHPLRELHPPDHHHLRPAVGGCRRAAGVDPVQDGTLGHRHDRHRDAGRHREEERHHDDRLRARAPPRRGRRRGRDPRGLPVALPADHDDDVRGDLRCAADRAWRRRGRRAAPAARHRGGRRAVRLAAPDALHHAGHLSLSRPYRPGAEAPPRAAAPGSRGDPRPAAVAAE